MTLSAKAIAAQIALFVVVTVLSLLGGMLLAAPTYGAPSLLIVTLLSGAGFFAAAVGSQRLHDRVIRAGLATTRAARSGALGR